MVVGGDAGLAICASWPRSFPFASRSPGAGATPRRTWAAGAGDRSSFISARVRRRPRAAHHGDDAHRRMAAGTTTTRGRRGPPLSSRGGAPPRLAVSHAPTGPTTRSPRTPTLHPAAAAARSLAARAPGTGSWLVAHLLPRKATPTSESTPTHQTNTPSTYSYSFSARDQPAWSPIDAPADWAGIPDKTRPTGGAPVPSKSTIGSPLPGHASC